MPCLFFVKERGNPSPRPIFNWAALRASTGETIRTMRSTRQYPGLARFLIGRVFYTDAINTVIAYMGLYTVNVALATGLSAEQGRTQAQLVLLSAVTCSVLGGFIWGVAVDRFGPKRTLDAVLVMWIGVFAMAAAVGAFALPLVTLYVVAGLAGIALGGVWSADSPVHAAALAAGTYWRVLRPLRNGGALLGDYRTASLGGDHVRHRRA